MTDQTSLFLMKSYVLKMSFTVRFLGVHKLRTKALKMRSWEKVVQILHGLLKKCYSYSLCCHPNCWLARTWCRRARARWWRREYQGSRPPRLATLGTRAVRRIRCSRRCSASRRGWQQAGLLQTTSPRSRIESLMHKDTKNQSTRNITMPVLIRYIQWIGYGNLLESH